MDLKKSTYSDLEEYFSELESHDLILHSLPPITFFDISGYPHYEDVISNYYRFFLDPEAEHGFGRMFLNALLNQLDRNIDFVNIQIKREHSTDKGGSIDLCIIDEAENDEILNAIIIENKIYSGLRNDLIDYFNSVPAKNKVGIYLTLNNEKLPDEAARYFLNVTHKQWMDGVKAILGGYILNSNEKYLILLKDFIQNIENMSNEKEMNSNIKFYFEHSDKIKNLIELKRIAEQHLINVTYKLFPHGDWTWARVIDSGFSIKYGDGSIVGYFNTSSVYFDKKFSVSCWLSGQKVIDQWKQKVDQQWLKGEYGNNFELITRLDGKSWLLFSRKNYEIEGFDNIQNFGELAIKILDKDWEKFITDNYQRIH